MGVIGSNLAPAAASPVPWCCLSLLSPCGASIAGTWLAGAGGPGSCDGDVGLWVLLIGSARATELRGSSRVGPEPVLRQEG